MITTYSSLLSFNHGFDALTYIPTPCGLQCAPALTMSLRQLLDWSSLLRPEQIEEISAVSQTSSKLRESVEPGWPAVCRNRWGEGMSAGLDFWTLSVSFPPMKMALMTALPI